MSEVKTNKVSPVGANGTVTLGDSGDTITVPSGVTFTNNGTATGFGSNAPAFEAYLSSDQSVSDNVLTKLAANTEVFDSNDAYDNSTYRFTVPSGEGGKYFVYAQIVFYSSHGGNDLQIQQVLIKKNGSNAGVSETSRNQMGIAEAINYSSIMVLSAADYLEVWGLFNNVQGSSYTKFAGDSYPRSFFGAYKMMGI